MRGSRSVCSRAWGGGVGGVRWGWIQTELPFGFGKTLSGILKTLEFIVLHLHQMGKLFVDLTLDSCHDFFDGMPDVGEALLVARDLLAESLDLGIG